MKSMSAVVDVGDTTTAAAADVGTMAAGTVDDDDDDDGDVDDSVTSTSVVSAAVEDGVVTQTLPPSHITPDGDFINLPPPNEAERVRFFERSIARHGLLEDDLKPSKQREQGEPAAEGDQQVKEGDDKEEDKKSLSQPKIHPLALASARLREHGINELHKAINLQTLVSKDGYFGLTNIVDPEIGTTTSTDNASSEKQQHATATSTATTVKATVAATKELDLEEPRTRAMYVLKRKHAQFENAAATLKRHRSRLEAAVVAQSQPDQRLRELRPQWRLVAPEHGTRALPHATRPTEVVAADVDVYYSRNASGTVSGRLASRVPSYATIELRDDYKVQHDLKKWQQLHAYDLSMDNSDDEDTDEMDYDPANEKSDNGDTDKMDVDREEKTDKAEEPNDSDSAASTEQVCTRAEPFAIADPALGKLDADFDPKKVVMLTLQFDIEKPSTGFCQSACLEPIASSSSSSQTSSDKSSTHKTDENLLVALQHSLFCAKLFESIRRELAPDTEGIGQVRTSAKAQSAVWLSGESEQNFLPPPSLMMSGVEDKSGDGGLQPLCVVYTHEGDLKVLLDCEYSLRVRLVEAGSVFSSTDKSKKGLEGMSNSTESDSGSQSPEQLMFLCRALLLHAQETHHRHSVQIEKEMRHHEEQEIKRDQIPHVKAKEYPNHSARILQSCVSLGMKMLFERRIRKSLSKVDDWIKTQVSDKESLKVEWLSLSVFDQSAQFNVSFRSWSIDANIAGDELTVTNFGQNGEYRKAKFHSDDEFELYLKMTLRRLLRAT